MFAGTLSSQDADTRIAVCRIGFIGLMLNLTSITFGGITLYGRICLLFSVKTY